MINGFPLSFSDNSRIETLFSIEFQNFHNSLRFLSLLRTKQKLRFRAKNPFLQGNLLVLA
ncbi:hypothetical protein CANARDRAFT_28522 [[Candida] arabinofermentans NRRL YB-2248]|uniref:Uncharacterized protein n=1 Tax=[Candida] arabinofermentans NRRL YB-2248 TaxID=983967 RepID=A0A1E4T0J7_9ASCO|nr:hypothetical protein CANARDRAFT_28522 [[Candida] arabinofermentans NRRL YB-2248]